MTLARGLFGATPSHCLACSESNHGGWVYGPCGWAGCPLRHSNTAPGYSCHPTLASGCEGRSPEGSSASGEAVQAYCARMIGNGETVSEPGSASRDGGRVTTPAPIIRAASL